MNPHIIYLNIVTHFLMVGFEFMYTADKTFITALLCIEALKYKFLPALMTFF